MFASSVRAEGVGTGTAEPGIGGDQGPWAVPCPRSRVRRMADPEAESNGATVKAQRGAPPPSGGAVYGLGFIGALVWFWGQADGVGGHALGVLKALVWPAFLVHDAFKVLGGPGVGPSASDG